VGGRPTVYDVARRAGVSIATVSFAFRRPEQVRPDTRAAVLKAAREIGYIPSAAARGLASGRTGALGLHSFDLLLEQPQAGGNAGGTPATQQPSERVDLTQSFIPWDAARDETLADPRAFPLYVDEVQRGFELECKSQGRPLLLSSGVEASAITETAGRVDGLAVFPGRSAAASLEWVSDKMPVVLFSVPPAEDGYHRVLVDNESGVRALVTHLVDVHQLVDLGFVGALSVADYSERFTAFQAALAEHDLQAPGDVVDATVLGEGPAFVDLTARVRSDSLPQALVCASDQIALAVLDLLSEQGVGVPHDAVVTGFDGILAGRLSDPTLTTVRQPMETMGRIAARLLIEETAHPSERPRVLRLGTQLIVRESCGCRP
jgi:LacI family transcriptional regulator